MMTKKYVRSVNGMVSVDEIQGIAWKLLRDKFSPTGKKLFSVIFFLKGGNKFNTTVSESTLNKSIKRFKQVWTSEYQGYTHYDGNMLEPEFNQEDEIDMRGEEE